MTYEEALQTIVKKLTEAGHTVVLSSPTLRADGFELVQQFIRSIDGIRIDVWFREETPAGYSWRNRPACKLRGSVGGFGDKTQYPQLKNGEFNWAKMVEDIGSRIKHEKLRREQAENGAMRRAEADVECCQLRAVFGLQEYGGKVQVHPTDSGIELRVAKGITKEQAEILLRAAKEAGLLG